MKIQNKKEPHRNLAASVHTKNVARDPLCSRPPFREAIGQEGFFLGGRTRARTWNPLIKRHPIRIDFSRKFFQLNQNQIITDQWLTAKYPTARARDGWLIDAFEA